MAKCLVTGGAGFIGSHMTDALLAAGHEVVVIDSLMLGNKDFVHANASFHEVDIRDFDRIQNLFEGVSAVFHFAAEPRLPLTIEQPIESHDINVTGTLNVLEAARLAGVKKVVFSSSAAIYGDQEVPVKESVQLKPKSPYSLHKIIGEEYMRLYHRLYDMETVCLRYFNVYGPRKGVDGGYPACIPIFLKQAQEGSELTIVGDGEQTRDYVHVSDIVRANMIAWESAVVDGDAFNIATGVETSVNAVADIVGGEKKSMPPRIEIRRSQADISKAKDVLGWEPTVSFEHGMESLKKEWEVS